MNATLFIIAVWPSKVAKLKDFKSFIGKYIFGISENTKIKVELRDDGGEEYNVDQCAECVEKFRRSNLRDKMNAVLWNLVDTSAFRRNETVSNYI